MIRVCVLLVSMCVLGGGSLSGRGFFCRDPDTGMLHPVNSTWPSSSFCGKYHCKLRRKNLTGTEYAPARQINITNVKLLGENLTLADITNGTISIKKDVSKENVLSMDKKNEPGISEEIRIQDILPLDANIIGIQIKNKSGEKNGLERDRYLTDTEIKTISEILHTVKKSDLDAIVEIYNLAQDIYKEIDKTSTDHVLDEALYSAKRANNFKDKIDVTRNAKSSASYWYEPLSSGKVRPADLTRVDLMRAELVRNDMIPIISVIPAKPVDLEEQGSSVIKVASSLPTQPASVTPPTQYSQQMTASYFNGALSYKDFGKLPYYYPITNFQKISSYVHQNQQPINIQQPTTINQSKMPRVNEPIVKPAFKPITYKPQLYSGGKYIKEIKPSILLPYPFSYIHHYNWTYPHNVYNGGSSRLDQFELRNQEKNNKNTYTVENRESKVKVVKNYVQKVGNAVLMNPDLENFQDLEVKPTRGKDGKPLIRQTNKDEERRPDWQTDPLPNDILEDVRAHLKEKQRLLRPLPLRKKIKLERVGKLIKLDELVRPKRAVVENNEAAIDEQLEPELYEVYIERTTCNSDYSVPGYFRYGNLSQPFPDCCPQRISRR